jgi:D-3-phosphoglycerate dehydrogenase
MRVVVTDRKYEDEDHFTDVVESAGGEIDYGDYDTYEAVIEGCRDADIVICSKAPITQEVVEAMGDGELSLRLGTGFDNVDVRAATEQGIPVSNVPSYCTQEVGEHAVTLMLAAGRDIVEADHHVRNEDGWGKRADIKPMYDGVFGVVGFGRIGRAAAGQATGLGMDVIAYDPYLPDDIIATYGAEPVDFEDLITRADAVSVHTPLTSETHHLLGEEEFAAMKDTTVVVNTARGPIIDVEALAHAVESGELWGAGLDVFESEPPEDSPAFRTDRIICSPHHGGSSARAKDRFLAYVQEKVRRVIEGGHHGEIVNPEVYRTAYELSPESDNW